MNIKPPQNTPHHSRQNSKTMQKRKSLRPTVHFQKLVIMYHWSLMMNKLQRIMLLRCRQPLRDMCLQLVSTARSTDFKSERIIQIQHKHMKHVRYTSDEVPKKYTKQFFQNEEYFDEEKQLSDLNARTQKCINNSTVKQLLSERNTAGSQSQTAMEAETPCRLDDHQINQEFLALFDRNPQSSKFGILSPNKQLEQVELIRKINQSQPQQPKPDLDNFLELIKRPEIKRIKRNSEVNQQSSDFSQLYFVLLLPFLIIGFIKILF